MENKKLLYILTFSAAWALSIFVRKLALNEGAEPLPFLLTSSLISVVLLTSYVLTRKRSRFAVFKSPRALKQFLLLGFFVGSAWVFDTLGLTITTSINNSFIMKSGFIFSVLFAAIFFKEKLTQQKIWLVSLFLVGAYLITTGGQSLVPARGDLIVVAATFLYSCATVIQKFLTKKADPTIIGWGRLVAATTVLSVWMGLTGSLSFTFEQPLYIILTGVLLSLTTVFLNKALSVANVSYVTMMTMTVPVMNAVLGTVFLHESMNAYQIIGGLLIIIGGIFANKWKI